MTLVTSEENGGLTIGTAQDRVFSAFSEESINKTIEIPSSINEKSVFKISKYAFYNYQYVEIVIMNSPLQTIGLAAFQACKNLKRVFIPSSTKKIASNCFDDCFALSSVVIEQNSQLESIGNFAFNTCKNLSYFSIPASLKSLGDSVFSEIEVNITVYYCGKQKFETSLTLFENTPNFKVVVPKEGPKTFGGYSTTFGESSICSFRVLHCTYRRKSSSFESYILCMIVLCCK